VKKEVRNVIVGQYVEHEETLARVVGRGTYPYVAPERVTTEQGVYLVLTALDGTREWVAQYEDPRTLVEMGWSVAVGLPVVFMGNHTDKVLVEVDWSEAVQAIGEEVDDGHILGTVEAFFEKHHVLPVAYPRPLNHESEPVRERCECGAPVAVWYDPEPDGDATPRSRCLTEGCYKSTT
jgi:hypothetical protein